MERVYRRIRKVFDSLEKQSYLGPRELQDFRYFDRFYSECLARIDDKIRMGTLVPQDTRGFPGTMRFLGHRPRAGVFIGSFDPFQMTHLAMAMRFLASDQSEADLVYAIPEGSPDVGKPHKTEYRFRYDILASQLTGIFEPFIVPFDIGDKADTIEVVNRLIAHHAGSSLRLTHIVGSDVLPVVVKYIKADLDAWKKACARNGVDLDFSSFIIRREMSGSIAPLLKAVRAAGVRVVLDRRRIGTPSSTDFRATRAVTICLPTEAMLARLEILFRYSMNTPWMNKNTLPDSPSRWEI